MLIDEELPTFDVAERHQLVVRAQAARVYAVVRRLDLSGSRVVRGLFALRGVPARLTGRGRGPSPLGLTLDELLQRGGFVLLAERPGEELLLGLVGRFWTTSGALQRVDPAGFRAFDRPGFAKAVWNFHLAPAGQGKTLLSTETRVLCLDPASRRSFRRYWRLIRPFSGLIRRIALREIRRRAEAAAGTSSSRA